LSNVPNKTLCTDGTLVRVGFMSPPDVEAFMLQLEKDGLTFARDGKAIDMAVVDQNRGLTIPAKWLEFARLTLDGTDNKVAVCWLFEDTRRGFGIHMPSTEMPLATPEGWRYENSLSANFKFVSNEDMNKKMKFLRHKDGLDVYLDLSSAGEDVYVGRTQASHTPSPLGHYDDKPVIFDMKTYVKDLKISECKHCNEVQALQATNNQNINVAPLFWQGEGKINIPLIIMGINPSVVGTTNYTTQREISGLGCP